MISWLISIGLIIVVTVVSSYIFSSFYIPTRVRGVMREAHNKASEET